MSGFIDYYNKEAVFMKEGYEEKYHFLENNHWWFRSRKDIILKLLQGFSFKKNVRILDVGCSGGNLIKFLKKNQFSNIYGIDISQKAVFLARNQGLENIQRINALRTNFKDEFFDIIIASDILEHLKDNKKALWEWKRVLKRNGRIVVFVPAFNFLWSKHDKDNGHFRRYDKKKLKELCREVDLTIERIDYWNFFSFFPALILCLLDKLIPFNFFNNIDRLHKTSDLLNNLLIILLKIENFLFSKNIKFPVGLSLLVVLAKR